MCRPIPDMRGFMQATLQLTQSRCRQNPFFRIAGLGIIFAVLLGQVLVVSAPLVAGESDQVFSLADTIQYALDKNLSIKTARQDTLAALSAQKVQRSNFLPTLNSTYQYRRYDQGTNVSGLTTASPNEYTFTAGFTQPIFTGFALLNQYEIASLDLDISQFNEKLIRQDVIRDAKNVYFLLLRAQKLLVIAQDTVVQIDAQKEVARNFYEVGMTPLNDFLEAEVALANAKQDLVIAENDLATAKSNFNLLLRRPINAPVVIEDIQGYKTFEHDMQYCFETANDNRLEFIVADKDIEIAEKQVELARKNYYPSVSLEGNYYRRGDNWDVDGGNGIFDPSGWTLTATASWDFWEWGRSYYSAKEQLNRLNQARYRKEDLQDNIDLEVKQAYLKLRETEKNITTVEKAIVQAQENFRINQERFKEQVATSTDVLDAQTLLSRTRTRYFSALYDFKIAKAALYRAMGLEVYE